MCGILGGAGSAGAFCGVSDAVLNSALSRLNHRGPDASSVRRFRNSSFFAHARLAIIDLKPESNQPMSVNDRHWIVFNGEIFNYADLRKELQSLGHSFKTQSDTEFNLRAYQQWGERCVSEFNCM